MRFLLTLIALCAAAQTPQHRLPSLSSVFPQGDQPGRTVRVEVLGHYLDRTQHVVFLDSSLRGRVVSADYTRLSLEFDIDAKAAYGSHYFRVVSPRGASNVLLFRIGDLPHVREKEPNTRLEEAQPVSVPSTVNGRLNVDGDFDFFRFRAGKGQTLVLDVRSARNGSGLDPALILLDSRGRKLDHSEERFIWDPMLVHTFAEDGEYVAVIQPTHTGLSETFGYQFDIRTSPYLESVSPISMRPGSEVNATIFGEGITRTGDLWFDSPGFSGQVLEARGRSARVSIRTPQAATPGEYHIALVMPEGRSNEASFLIDDTTPHAGGAELQPPVSVTSIIRYRQPEQFFFEAAANETLLFEIRAQRFGSPVDPVIRIFDAAGKRVAMNDDGKFTGVLFNKDPQLIHTFEKAGRYRLEVRNVWKVRGESAPYQLVVRRPAPEAELEMATDNPFLYPGEPATLRLNAVRKEGHEGPIPVEITGLREPFQAEMGEVRRNRSFGEVAIRAKDAKPGEFFAFEVKRGFRFVRISGGGGEGATAAVVRSGTIAVAEKPHFSLEALTGSVNLVRSGKAEFRVAIERAQEFTDRLRFEVINLPPGIRMEPATAAASDREVILKLTADPGVAKGRHSRVAALGRAEDGEIQLTPLISIVVE